MLANKVMKGQQRIYRKEGNDKTFSKCWVSKPDMNKMYEFVCDNLDDPETLQHKVYLDLAFYTARRGREGLCDLRIDSFEIKFTEDGRKYIVMTHNETKKKKQGDESASKMQNSEKCPIMIEQPGSKRSPC